MQCSDWNAVKFDGDCVVGGFLQFHTFENMMLKVKQTHIRHGCAISSGATIMSGVVIEPDTTVLPLSLVLKEMDLHTAIYHGSPVEPVLAAVTDPGAAGEANVRSASRADCGSASGGLRDESRPQQLLCWPRTPVRAGVSRPYGHRSVYARLA